MVRSHVASKEQLDRAIEHLKLNGMGAEVVNNGVEAKARVLQLIPRGAEVMTMTSKTLEATGIAQAINESGNYSSVRNRLNQLDRQTQSTEMQKLGAAPVWAVGSVQAVTEIGQIIMASMSGSQLPAYVYGSQHVIWVVGTQKIVRDTSEALKRIYEYVLPLESKRVQEAYGIEGSYVSKILIINKEMTPYRIHIIFVEEPLGF